MYMYMLKWGYMYMYMCVHFACRLSWGMVRGEGGGVATGRGSSSYASGVSRLATRSRMLLRRRGSGRSLTSHWPLVPASDVPDSLVNQVKLLVKQVIKQVCSICSVVVSVGTCTCTCIYV